ncbi:hypothetical protein LCGC14_2269030 [marine sediment metagenome]|uniref:Uncharacterized protein n=1 Tax=marine sediment metagenome TaxID=412755 RepID=A0A0F9FSJ5_9ZZZZ
MSSRYSKRHYEDVARILRADRMEARIRPEDDTLANVTADFADLFAADNPRCAFLDCQMHKGFDRARFLAACGLEPKNCPLCFCPSKDGDVHPSCADTEQAYSDYVAGKMAGELDE